MHQMFKAARSVCSRMATGLCFSFLLTAAFPSCVNADTQGRRQESKIQTTGTLALPWFGPSNWYLIADQGGIGPSSKLVYTNGDFNAMFGPGAQWDPSKIGVLIMGKSDIMLNRGTCRNWRPGSTPTPR